MRRLAITLASCAASIAVVGCGKSAGLPSHSSAQTGSGGSGAGEGQASTPAQARTLAQALNLQASDLPGFSVASEAKHSSAVEHGLEVKLRACMGGGSLASALGQASSKTFQRRAKIFDVTVSSSVKIAKTPAQAESELKLMSAGKTQGCLRGFVAGVLAAETHDGAKPQIVSISKGVPSAPGTSGAYGWRMTGEFSADEVHVPFYIDLLGFTYRQANVTMFSIGLPLPFPVRAERDLFALLVARARTAGALKLHGRGATPTVSGPRKVEV